MKEALADKPATPFRIPQGIVLSAVDARSGTPVSQGTPGSILEAFKPGTEPGSGFALSDLDDPGSLRPFTVQTGGARVGYARHADHDHGRQRHRRTLLTLNGQVPFVAAA